MSEPLARTRLMKRCHVAYGLGIHSALLLPELVMEEAEVIVHVRLGDTSPVDLADVRAITADEADLSWKDIGIFHVRRGNEIVINPAPGADESVLRLFTLGPVLALLLRQRGRLVLHGSAVSIDGEAVAFLGDQGWGKSTIAATLYARGHKLVADDVVALEMDGAGSPTLYPGFPRLKLWPDAVTMMGKTPDTLQRLHPRYEKRAYPAARGFSTKALSLRCVYILAQGTDAQVETLEPQAALAELIRHTYSAPSLDANRAPSHLRQCASLVGNVPIRRLTARRLLAALPDLAVLVEHDLAGTAH